MAAAAAARIRGLGPSQFRAHRVDALVEDAARRQRHQRRLVLLEEFNETTQRMMKLLHVAILHPDVEAEVDPDTGVETFKILAFHGTSLDQALRMMTLDTPLVRGSRYKDADAPMPESWAYCGTWNTARYYASNGMWLNRQRVQVILGIDSPVDETVPPYDMKIRKSKGCRVQ